MFLAHIRYISMYSGLVLTRALDRLSVLPYNINKLMNKAISKNLIVVVVLTVVLVNVFGSGLTVL
jgi:hypothetical protein